MNVFKKLSLLTVSAVMAVTLAACNNTAKDILSKQGNIIGDSLVGDFNEKRAEEILKMVDDIKSGMSVTPSQGSAAAQESVIEKQRSELLGQESEIFAEHKEICDKVFANVNKANAEENSSMPYAEFLQMQVDSMKDEFSEEQHKIIEEDLKKIDELEMKIQELDK